MAGSQGGKGDRGLQTVRAAQERVAGAHLGLAVLDHFEKAHILVPHSRLPVAGLNCHPEQPPCQLQPGQAVSLTCVLAQRQVVVAAGKGSRRGAQAVQEGCTSGAGLKRRLSQGLLCSPRSHLISASKHVPS